MTSDQIALNQRVLAEMLPEFVKHYPRSAQAGPQAVARWANAIRSVIDMIEYESQLAPSSSATPSESRDETARQEEKK